MPMVDKNLFFRQVTDNICDNLYIDEALKRCHRHLIQFMPCSDMSFVQYDLELNAFSVIAKIKDHLLIKDVENISITPLQRKKIWKEVFNRMKEVLIINQPDEISSLRFLNKSAGFSLNSSIIILRLSISGSRIGFFMVGTQGTNQYTKTHTDLLRIIHPPLSICMANALKNQELVRLKDILYDNNRFFQCELNDLSGTEIIGANGGLRPVMEMVRRVAQLGSPIFLEGETGVGKGLIANTLHRMSKRSEGPFISINCGAIPDSLLDSELFGHEKGSFTGAIGQKRGRFERAHKGTIFLDEVGELPHQAQVRLLHVLQNKEIERVGGTQTIPVDIRIISATNRNLEEMVKAGKFREDLWYRLNVFPIRIPPLRQRKEDIPALVHFFIEKKSIELKKNEQPILTPETLNRLVAYQWPGNVRELQNIVERTLIQHTQGPLRFNDTALWPEGKQGEFQYTYTDARGQLLPLKKMTAVHIRRALARANGKLSGPGGAAEFLAINPNTLRKRMDKLQIPYRKKRTRRNRPNQKS